MTISYNWLRDYINTNLTVYDLSIILTDIGLEVESYHTKESIEGSLDGLVVGEILSCEKHPDADKLKITTVNIGTEQLQVVCGASNVHVGAKVILATIGTTLYPNGDNEGSFKIKRSKIRGVESYGMLCSGQEIGIGTSNDGILLLSIDAIVGVSASTIFNVTTDTIFEIGLTPNRVDAASHYGVARDIAAYLQAQGEKIYAKLPSIDGFGINNNSKPIDINVENSNLAPRYMGITMSGITVLPSPEWLQTRLKSIGINPKNNIVDITNFVLHECGQPLHTFDLSKIDGSTINVKRCAEGSKFTTLDGVERILSNDDLMICDSVKPLCLAGVLGGDGSSVTESTTAIFIESAYFNSVTVRKTARRHGLSTDASFLYERGTDPNMPPYALMRCAMLIQEVSGGEVTSSITDLYPNPVKPFEINVNINRINSLIGNNISKERIKTILKGLDIDIKQDVNDDLTLLVPPYRVDVTREADIVEEVLRIYGFNNITNPTHIKSSITHNPQQTTDKLVTTISNMLSSMGYNEIMSNSLTKSSYYEGLTCFSKEKQVKLLNPLSNDLNVMRQTLLFNSLEALQLNIKRKRSDLRLFEIGNCYTLTSPNTNDVNSYGEEQNIAITITGNDSVVSWNSNPTPISFYSLKESVENIFSRLGLNIYEGTWSTVDNELYIDAYSYSIRGSKLFTIGLISKPLLNSFEIKQPVYFVEMSLYELQKLVNSVRVKVLELNKYQPIKRDLALLVDNGVKFEALRNVSFKAERKHLKSVSLFDVYQGDKLPDNKKSYALSFVLEATVKTLTDKEIDSIMNNISSSLSKHCGAEVRS